MELSPKIYHWIVRPKWFSKKYITNHLHLNYCFNNKSVLDFGCGIGTNCTIFKADNYLGVDCDLKRVKYACDCYPEYCFEVVNDSKLPVSGGVIDYILSISVLHHISGHEIPGYLKEFKRVLKPDGKVILIEPCASTNISLRSRLMCLVDRGNHIRNKEEYVGLFEQHNFKVKTIDMYNQLFVYRKIIIEARLM